MSATNCWNLRVTAEVNQGGRRYMEDVTAVQFERAKGDKKVVEYAAFAIFDGHGGKEAAHYARDHILENIKNQKSFFSKDIEAVRKAIRSGFIATHHQMWNELSNWPKTYNGHPSTAGTTASLVIIRGNKMYVANVGDSMVVMGTRDYRYKNNPRAFQAMELTVDHKPELPEERKRIELCGGCVMNKAGVNRVVWNRPKLSHHGPIRRSTKLDRIPFLAIARSLGDLWSFNSELSEFIVSPEPDVHVYDLIDGREQFVILASDGLWNMVRPYESVTSAGTFDDRKRSKQVTGTPAHELVQLALDRWKMRAMRADNTSVIVVYIERKKMESTANKRDTYSESWTSARLEGSRFQLVNMPYRSADKPSSVTKDSPPAVTNSVEEIAVPDSFANLALFPPQRDSTVASTSAAVEPVQDCHISSSSGEILDKNNAVKMNVTERPSIRPRGHPRIDHTDGVADELSNSTVGNCLSTSEPVTGFEFGRTITRTASRVLENSLKRVTRSNKRKTSFNESIDRSDPKRRKSSGEDLTNAKSRKMGSPGKAHKIIGRKRNDVICKSSPTLRKLGEFSSITRRPKLLDRSAKRRSQVHSASMSRSKSEPFLTAARNVTHR